MYDLDMGNHVVFSRELLETNRARIVLDVGLVRGHVMPTEIADVCVSAMADGATIDVALFNAEVSHGAFGSFVFSLKRAVEFALTDIRFGGDEIEHGTTKVLLRDLLLRLGVGVLRVLGRRWSRSGFSLKRRGTVLLAKASFEVDAYVGRR